MSRRIAIGIDLGGTNVKVALVDAGGIVVSQDVVAARAERGPQPLVEDAVCAARRLLAEGGVAPGECLGVGIGTPGPLDLKRGVILKAANLPGWVQVPLRDMFGSALRLPAALDNDANAAAFGEWWAGEGQSCGDLVLLTLGTGVGAGVVIGGKVLHGHFDNAAELGHMIVALDGLPCPCGQRGCLEQYASAAGVANRVTQAIRAGTPSTLAARVQAGEGIDSRDVAAAARAGDELCARVWGEACRYLAMACVNIQHSFNPQKVLLGGGMAESGMFLVDRVRAELAQLRWRLADDLPEVSLARLGYNAGVIGAAALVHSGQAP